MDLAQMALMDTGGDERKYDHDDDKVQYTQGLGPAQLRHEDGQEQDAHNDHHRHHEREPRGKE
jgi:hypothetical protein